MLGAFGIDAVEVRLVQTFRHAGSMNHIVELTVLHLLRQPFFRVQVQLYQVDATVL